MSNQALTKAEIDARIGELNGWRVVDGKLEKGFEFRNPNVKDACGCGESFTT